MKRKHKCNCDDLVREIIERNRRGFIQKSLEGEDVANDAGIRASESTQDKGPAEEVSQENKLSTE